MKTNSIRNHTTHSQKQTGQLKSRSFESLGMEINVSVVKSRKDRYDPEKVRRQRQDLFDNWELKSNKNLSAKI